MSPVWFIIGYLLALYAVAWVLFLLMQRFIRQKRKRAQWVLVAVALVVVGAHWYWPFLLR